MSYREQIYGEINDLNFLYSLINVYTNYRSLNYNFYDFGSGYGNIVISYNDKFRKCFGIEIVKERCNIAEKNNNYLNVCFINTNFFNIKLESKFVILINNLCFGEGTNKRLSVKILEEANSEDIIIVTKKLTLLNEYFRNFYLIDCTWGESEIYIYMIK
tara:strand:- start:692 stop:1168 length:477 start_codon:yes stop_codon:yes gene_type:complete